MRNWKFLVKSTYEKRVTEEGNPLEELFLKPEHRFVLNKLNWWLVLLIST